MQFDKLTEYSNEQAITATAISTNILDHGPGDVGPGQPIEVVVKVIEAFNTLTSLTIALETDGVEAFSSSEIIQQTKAVLLAELVAGYEFRFSILPAHLERYTALRYTVGGTDPTEGSITARLALDRQANNPNFS